MDRKLIEINSIRKVYGAAVKVEVLKGINLSMQQGEFLSIIGPSGSGKSTLLNILGTLDQPTSGSYLFLGKELGKMKQKELSVFRNQSIGFIFQFHHLLPEFSAIENVLMPYWISRKSITRETRRKAEEMLDTVGVLSRKDNKANNLSGGQQQRVAIARALMNDPPLILADEPTGNLDSESTEQAYSLLRNINRHKGTTFVIVTHDMHIAAKSDRIIEILDGQIKRDFMIEKNRREVWNNISPCNCFLKREE